VSGAEWIPAGTIVQATAGNDAGRYYLVLAIAENGTRRLLSDGRHIKMSCPTAKNVKHLKVTGLKVDLTDCNTDRKIRRALTKLQFGGCGAFSEQGR
jgi:ribosomal protein L14E/L6E/L27E